MKILIIYTSKLLFELENVYHHLTLRLIFSKMRKRENENWIFILFVLLNTNVFHIKQKGKLMGKNRFKKKKNFRI